MNGSSPGPSNRADSAHLPTTPGVYLLTHRVTGDTYIGSARDVRRRVREHFWKARRGDHSNRGIRELSRRHGPKFAAKVLDCCSLELLSARELRWAAQLRPTLNRAPIRSNGIEPTTFLHRDPKTPDDEVNWTGLMTRRDRARFKLYCETLGLEMEEVGPRWIMERLTQEESQSHKAKPRK